MVCLPLKKKKDLWYVLDGNVVTYYYCWTKLLMPATCSITRWLKKVRVGIFIKKKNQCHPISIMRSASKSAFDPL